MSCNIIFDNQGNKVGVYAENGQRDPLFDNILNNPNIKDFDQALSVYLESKNFRQADKLPLTLPVFGMKQFADLKGKMVNTISVQQMLNGVGIKQIEKDLINQVIEDNYKGQKRISYDELEATVRANIMPLERITTSSYADYGMDNLGSGNYGEAKTIILNAPIEHGVTGHFSGDFKASGRQNIKYVPKQLNDNVWVAVEEGYEANANDNNIYQYVGTAGTKEAVDKWINNYENETKFTNSKYIVYEDIFYKTKDYNNNVNPIEGFQTKEEVEQFIKDNNSKYNGNLDYLPQSDYSSTLKGGSINKGMFGHIRVWETPTEEKTISVSKEQAQKLLSEGTWIYTKHGDKLYRLYDERDLNDANNYVKMGKIFHVAELQSDYFQKNNARKDLITGSKEYKEEYEKIKDTSFKVEEEKYNLSKLKQSQVERDLNYYTTLGLSVKDAQNIIEKLNSEIKSKENYIKENTKDVNKEIEKLKEKVFLKLPPQEKQFIASQKEWEKRMVREAIKEASLSGATSLRFPTPYTLSVIEGYLSEGAPYEIEQANDSTYLEAGDRIYYVGEDYTVIDSDNTTITIAESGRVQSAEEQDIIDNEIENAVDNDMYEIENNLKDFYTQEEWNDFRDNYSPISSTELDEVGNEVEEGVFEVSEGKIRDIVSEYYNDVFTDANSILSDLGVSDIYQSGTTFYYTDGTANIETLMQPSEYKGQGTKDSFSIEDDLDDTQQTVARKYEEIAEILKKEKPVEIVTDENGFDWYEAPITEADIQSPVVAFSLKEENNKLKYKTQNGDIVDNYVESVQKSNGNKVEAGFNTVDGFKTLFTVDSSTNLSTLNGLVNNLIKNNLLSDKSYIDSKGRKMFVPKGNSLAKKIFNSELIKQHVGGKAIKSLENGDIYVDEDKLLQKIELISKNGEIKKLTLKELNETDLTKFEDYVGVLAAQEYKKARTQEPDTIEIIPENELQQKLLALLKKLGIKTLSISDYITKYGKKNNIPPSARALADLAERVIAFNNGVIEAEDLNEEVAHFIVSATPKTELENLLRNIHKTKEWMQFSKTYMDIYNDENLVREEILGKVLANALQNKFDASQRTEIEKSIFSKIKDIFDKFFQTIKAYFTPAYTQELNKYTDSIYLNLMQGTLDETLSLINRDATLFSVDNDLFKKSAEMLDVIHSQQSKLGGFNNIAKVRELANQEDAFSKLKSLSNMVGIAKKQVDQLERAVRSKKEGQFPFTEKENAVYEMYNTTTSQMLSEVNELLKQANFKDLTKEQENIINKDRDSVVAEIEAVQKKFNTISGLVGINENKAIKNLIDRVALKHNLTENQKADLQKAIESSQKDTAFVHAYLGSLVHARSPLLNLAGDIIANTTTQSRNTFLKTIKPFVQTLEDSKWTPKLVKELINGKYLINDIDNVKLDNFEEDIKLRIFNDITGKKETKFSYDLLKTLSPDELISFNTQNKEVLTEIKENFFKDEYLEKQAEEFELIDSSAIDFYKRDRAERAEIRARATKNGVTIYDKNDRDAIEDINKVRNEASSFYTATGELKKGLISKYNPDTKQYDFELDKEVILKSPEETKGAVLAYGLKQISDIISKNFEKSRENKKIPQKFIDMYNQAEDKMDFLFLNAYVGFNDDFWKSFANNETTLQKLEQAKTEENEEEIQELIDTIVKNQQIIRYIQKNNRVFNRPSETNVNNMHTSEKSSMKEAVENLTYTLSLANKFLKEEYKSNPDNLFTTTVNDSYYEEIEDRGIKTFEEELDFIKEHTTSINRRNINKVYDALVSGSKAPFFFKEELTEQSVLDFAKSKLLPYYKRTEPNGFTELLNQLKNQEISLEDFINNPMVRVNPNFSFYEEANNENINPKFLENKEKGRLQIKKGNITLKHRLFKGEVVNFDDARYESIQKNPVKKKIHEAFVNLQKTTLENYGLTDTHNVYKLPQVGKRGLRQKEDLIKKFTNSNTWKESIKDLVNFRQDEAEFGQDLEGNAAVKKINANIIPIYYVKDLENQEDVSDELLYTYSLMNQQSALYKARIENLGDMLSVKKAILDTTFEGKEAEASNMYKMFKSFMDYNFYGIKENLQYEINVLGVAKVDAAKVLRSFLKFTSYVNLSGITVSLVNLLQGQAAKTVEKFVGERIDNIANKLGRDEFFKLAPESMGEMLELNSKSTLNTILEYFGQSDLVGGRFENSNYNKFTRGLGKAPNVVNNLANFPIIPRVVLSVLMDNRYVDGRIMSYNQFKQYKRDLGEKDLKKIELDWQNKELLYNDKKIENNVFSIDTESAAKKLGKSQEEAEKYLKEYMLGVTSRIKIAVQDIDLAIPQEEKSMMGRNAAANLILMHRGWLTLSTQRRFKSNHLNLATGLYEEGIYVTLGKFIKDITVGARKKNGASYLQHVKNVWNGELLKGKDGNINQEQLDLQRRNLLRTAGELAVVNGLFIMGLLLANMKSDDDKDKDLFDEIIDLAYYFNYRTTNEVASSTIALPAQYYGVAQSPVIPLQMMRELGTFYDVFSSEKVQTGNFAGETKRFRKIMKTVPFMKDYYRLTNIQKATKDYKYHNEDFEKVVALSYLVNEEK